MNRRSRAGCNECRRRKIKCTEERPKCSRCVKSSRDCVFGPGIKFRHQQNASVQKVEAGDTPLKSFYSYRDSYDSDTVWVNTPKQLRFVPVEGSDIFSDSGSDHEDSSNNPNREKLSKEQPAAVDWPSPPRFTQASAATQGLEVLSTAATATTNDSYAFNKPSSSLAIDPDLEVGESIPPTLGLPRDFDEQRATGWLIRHFSEGPGRWLDLFDIAMFFSHHLPKEANNSPLLKHAAASVAAKQLARVKGRKLPIDGASSQPPLEKWYPYAEKSDWMYESAQHYDKSISLLMKAVADRRLTSVSQSTAAENPEASRSLGINSATSGEGLYLDTTGQGHSGEPYDTRFAGSDELAAAAAILSLYEFMDLSSNEWSHHLDGTKSLLELMMPLHSLSAAPHRPVSKARKSTFWCFARQDLLSAAINQTRTRLDTEDLPMWKEAGLMLDDKGYVMPALARNSWLPEDDNVAKEDMLSNALVWLMAKLVNFLVAADVLPNDGGTYPRFVGVDQSTLHKGWADIRHQIEVWHSGLPISFKPSYRRERSSNPQANFEGEEGDVFGELWYSKPMCGSTMMNYHWAQMMLLINEPQESTMRRTTAFKRFRAYTTATARIREHARDICAIAKSRPEAAVRINSVQPLFFAGQVLHNPAERRIIVQLLREIELDTGWSTEYRVRQLREYWADDGNG